MSIIIENVTLNRVELLDGLSGDDLRTILPACEEVTATAGQAVITAGQAEQALYILLDGSAEVDLEPARSGERPVAELTPGSVFGESSFFHASPHSATVKARTNVRLLKLNRGPFDQLLQRGNIAALRVATNAATILAARLQAADRLIVELLEQIRDEKVREALVRVRNSMSHSFSATVKPSFQVGSMQ